MKDNSKELWVLPIEEELRALIVKTHSTDRVTEKKVSDGTIKKVVIKKVKNLDKMYPKYVLPLHRLIYKALLNRQEYDEGVSLSRNTLAKKTSSVKDIAGLILTALQEAGIIVKTKKHSNGKRGKRASKYKLTEKYFDLLPQARKETFTRSQHGRMIDVLVKLDHQAIQKTKELNKELYGDTMSVVVSNVGVQEVPLQQPTVPTTTMREEYLYLLDMKNRLTANGAYPTNHSLFMAMSKAVNAEFRNEYMKCQDHLTVLCRYRKEITQQEVAKAS